MSLLQDLYQHLSSVDGAEKLATINELRKIIHEHSPNKTQPVDYVQWISIEKIKPNDYNPNSVASTELGLLLKSIEHDGYTQPIVTIYDKDNDCFVIVDGFHRYYVMKSNTELQERCHGLLPIVVINKSINDRMASTIRHNRARGKHTITGMSQLVFTMLENGWGDAEICNELGMEAEELLRIKHITGFSKLFKDIEYKQAWITRRQALIQRKYFDEHPDEKELY